MTQQQPTHDKVQLTPRLLTLSELPSWMRDNDYLKTSYRPHLPSLRACFYTAYFALTNETINVWSHTLGFFLFLLTAFRILGPTTAVSTNIFHIRHLRGIVQTGTEAAKAYMQSSVAKATRDTASAVNAGSALMQSGTDAAFASFDTASAAGSAVASDAKERILSMAASLRESGLPNAQFPIHVSRHDLEKALAHVLAEHKLGMAPLLAAACFCMAASAIYHAFWVYSPRALRALGKLDFLGISLLCCGHGISGVFYAFYCRPIVATWYYIAVGIAEAMTICAIFTPGFSSPGAKARRARTLIFSCLGASSFFPLIHAGVLHGWTHYEYHAALWWALAALVVYGVGALLYVSRYPECCRVGKHDRFFSSHQLMHFAVMAGVGLHLNGCYKMLDYRLLHGCSVSPLVT